MASDLPSAAAAFVLFFSFVVLAVAEAAHAQAEIDAFADVRTPGGRLDTPCSDEASDAGGVFAQALAFHDDQSCPGADVGGGRFRVQAAAEASFRSLSGLALVEIEGVDGRAADMDSEARAQARSEDQITIDLPGRAGDEVELVVDAALDGSLGLLIPEVLFDGATLGVLDFAVAQFGNSIRRSRRIEAGALVEDEDLHDGPLRVRITLGTPFRVQLDLFVRAQLDGNDPFRRVENGDGSIVADFGSSGGITSFELFELSGEPVPQFSISSASGDFGFYTPVPEPHSGLAGLTALLALGGLRSARRWKVTPLSP